MHPSNPLVPPPPTREPLTVGQAAPIAAASALPVVVSVLQGITLGSLAAGFTVGAVFFAGTLLVLRRGRPSPGTVLLGGMVVGAVTGVAWWALMNPPRSLEECCTLGALGGAAALAIELHRAWRRHQE